MMWPRIKKNTEPLAVRKTKRKKSVHTEVSISAGPKCKKRIIVPEHSMIQSNVEQPVRVGQEQVEDSTLPACSTTTNASQVLREAGSGFEWSEPSIDVVSLDHGKTRAEPESLRDLRRGRVHHCRDFELETLPAGEDN